MAVMPTITMPEGITYSFASSASIKKRYFLLNCIFCEKPFITRDDNNWYTSKQPNCLIKHCPHCKSQIVLCTVKCNETCEYRTECLINGFIEECIQYEILADIEDPEPYPQYQPMFPPVYGENVGYGYHTSDNTSAIKYTTSSTAGDRIIIKPGDTGIIVKPGDKVYFKST